VGQSLDLSSVVRRWPAGNGVSVEAEESPPLEAIYEMTKYFVLFHQIKHKSSNCKIKIFWNL
jgi:hypothetical protein